MKPTEVNSRNCLPSEYAFLEGDNSLPVIIAKELDVEETNSCSRKSAKVPQASSSLGKLSDIQDQPEFVPTRFLWKNYAPAVQTSKNRKS
ncbi:hypothetical protein Tco_0717625 [Tanacetum coccineum]